MGVKRRLLDASWTFVQCVCYSTQFERFITLADISNVSDQVGWPKLLLIKNIDMWGKCRGCLFVVGL